MGVFPFYLLSVCSGFFFFLLSLHRDLQIWSSVDDLQSLRPHFFCSIFTVNNQTLQLTFWPPVHLSWAFSFPFLCFSCSLSRVNENVALTDVVMCYTVYDHDLFLTQIIKGLPPLPPPLRSPPYTHVHRHTCVHSLRHTCSSSCCPLSCWLHVLLPGFGFLVRISAHCLCSPCVYQMIESF